DDIVFLPEAVENRNQLWLRPPQVREDGAVFEGVVAGEDPAVGLAVDPEGPVVLADGHPVYVGADVLRPDLPLLHLRDQVPQPVEFLPQTVVDVDEVASGSLLLRGVEAFRVRFGSAGSPALIPGR